MAFEALALRYARAPWTRAIGLLGRRSYPHGTALVFEGCHSIHTWFMAMAIDVVFIDDEWRVLAIHERLPPWRVVCEPRAAVTLELAAGEAAKAGLLDGDIVTRCEVNGRGTTRRLAPARSHRRARTERQR